MSNILIVGGTGNTGRRLILQLLFPKDLSSRAIPNVRAIVRCSSKLPQNILENNNFQLIEASVTKMDANATLEAVKGVDVIVSCLGHNITFCGIFCPPFSLVCSTLIRLCEACETLEQKTRVILMGTVGVTSPDPETDDHLVRSIGQNCFLGFINSVLPPGSDNYHSLHYLYDKIGKHHAFIEWCVVRPDSLLEGDEVTEYETHEALVTGLFQPRTTKRANVAAFMKQLIQDSSTWEQWKGKMPVVLDSRTTNTADNNESIAAEGS